MATLANSGLALAVTSICEADSPEECWAGPRGRLTALLLAACVPDVAAREVFICGPPPYMKAAHAVLAELGVDPGHVHQESFTLDVPAVPLTAVPDGPAEVDREVGTASLYFRRSGIDVACPPGTTVLEAATAAGVVIRSSCGQGLCGTCKSDLVSGQVDMQHAGGIRPREIAAGKFLPCCSYPTGDLVVDA
ncbi:2Fe-2S iron-sulfur cluster-binding protein [Ornithinimicrobium sp. INDO-MA30-4]|uniref:2Fe-2S iron-sulfur cluster-binding protein n=1 Tax=Ornithinimicrobium sp. INDO-MA30-4 TaxID=2908651 RepID=UPI001F1F427C|nr:2Fe-2S iron-sulfur cluster-binding protein [Ornithinimicrobium sp. INDO-MA30-4]UJH70739.1 2Fe-2S iron-sulfur cluster-binding protein [Ornithinimicrobium sp. INDO-MA30-4]